MKKLFSILLVLITGISLSQAALTSGYYKIKNTGYGRYMCEDFASQIIATSSTCGDTDYEKMWKVDVNGSTLTLQNIYTGHYAMTQWTISTAFPTGSTANEFSITESDNGYYLMSGKAMHCAATQDYKVVGWNDTESLYNYWTFESVSLTDAEVTTIQQEYASIDSLKNNAATYYTAFAAYFTDAACSEMKSEAKSATDASLKTNMNRKGIPTALQNLAIKIKNSWSSETDGTYSKMFRVHDYKCYSQASYWCNTLHATQMNDMSNPTGIYTNSKDVLYVFVGGDIPADCKLYLAGTTGNSILTYNSGAELQKGLNVVMASGGLQQYYIMYSTSSRTTDLSTIDKLRIHIEGGQVIGYVDTEGMEGETEVNNYYKGILDYANTKCEADGVATTDLNLMVLGNRGMFMFPIDTYNQIWRTTPYYSSYTTNYHIYKSIRWFDSVLDWEWGIMGFTKRVADGQTDEHEHVTGGTSEYGTVCNNKALTLQGAPGTNPYATWQRTSMPGVGGVESSYNAERADFDNWCVGHESGHDNQDLINLPSSTESSNNLFSNIVCYLTGYRMSRGEPVSTVNNYYVNGTQFALRDIGTTHRMYWQLYLYYHEAQNRTDFYPRLFASLRENELNLNSGTCFTELYKKVCDAAEEDLTDYFTVWGFLQPFENTTFGDYTTRVLTLTQAEIDAAKAYVKAKNYPKNTQILFIEDRIEVQYRWDAWANGSTDKRPDQGYDVGQCGVTGSVSSMTKGAASAATGSYLYSVSGNTLTLEGTSGGAGVIVYDKDGKILAYGNGTTITLPANVKSSDIVVKNVATDGSTVELKTVAEGGTDAQKLTALNDLIASAQDIVTKSNNKVVGYFRPAYITSLQTALTEAKSVVSNKNTAAYASAIETLQAAIDEVNNLKAGTYTLAAGNTYRFFNKAYQNYYIYAKTNDQIYSTETVGNYDDQKWLLEDAGEGKYYIKNVGTGKYISYIATSNSVKATATSTSDAFAFSIEDQGQMAWALNTNTSTDAKPYIHMSGAKAIVGWANDQDASRWYIQLVDETEDNAARANLEETVASSNELLDLVASNFVEAGETTINLTGSQITSNHKEPKEGSYANMVDGNASTFFHSTWSETTTDKHYWQVDLADEPVGEFKFAITSRAPSNATNPNNFPKNITVAGSNSGTSFTTIATVSNTCASTGQVSWESDVIGQAAKTYRYIRFTVNSTTSGNVGNSKSTYDYFALAEFGMTRVQSEMTFDVNEGYDYVPTDLIANLYTETKTAEGLLADSETTSSALTTENTTLTATYNALNDVIEAHERSIVGEELTTLVAKTEALINEAVNGSYSYETESSDAAVLLTKSMLSTNHQETTEGPIENMIDGSTSTYFHSTWSTATTDKHYWQVDLGEGNLIDEFKFSMTSRNNNPNNFPSDITVSGSDNGTTFTVIKELTNSLGTSGSVTYDSPVIGTHGKTYRYLRFTVNKTGSGNGNNNNATYYFFCLSKFSLTDVTNKGFYGTVYGHYNKLSTDLLISAASQLDATKAEMNEESTTLETLKARLQSLKSAYKSLIVGMGDVNEDESIDISDLSTLIKKLESGNASTQYDYDASGSTTVDDATKLQNILLKKQ